MRSRRLSSDTTRCYRPYHGEGELDFNGVLLLRGEKGGSGGSVVAVVAADVAK